MKEKLSQMAFKAGRAVSAAANKTADYVQTHKPTEQDLAQAKALALKAGKAVADETVSYPTKAAWRAVVEGHSIYGKDGSLTSR